MTSKPSTIHRDTLRIARDDGREVTLSVYVATDADAGLAYVCLDKATGNSRWDVVGAQHMPGFSPSREELLALGDAARTLARI